MPKEDNLMPPWPKGVSGNPNGRPVGSLNFDTVLRKICEKEVDTEVDGQHVKIPKGELALIRWLHSAIEGKAVFDKDGNEVDRVTDWKAMQAIMERLHGKSVESVKLQGDKENPVEVNINNTLLSQLTESRKKALDENSNS